MSKRIATYGPATYGPAVLVGLFATAIMLSTNCPAVAADDCLTAPNHPPGPGAHWRVRNDTVNNRKCWYLAEPEAPALETSQRSPDPTPEQPGFAATAIVDTSGAVRESRFGFGQLPVGR